MHWLLGRPRNHWRWFTHWYTLSVPTSCRPGKPNPTTSVPKRLNVRRYNACLLPAVKFGLLRSWICFNKYCFQHLCSSVCLQDSISVYPALVCNHFVGVEIIICNFRNSSYGPHWKHRHATTNSKTTWRFYVSNDHDGGSCCWNDGCPVDLLDLLVTLCEKW